MPPAHPLALVNGTVRTLDDHDSVVSAVLCDRGRFAAVGGDAAVLTAAPPDTEVVDLDGRTVLPGLVDAHAHVEVRAHARQVWLDLRGVTRAEALRHLGRAVGAHPGGWVVAQGTHAQERPTKADLDEVSPDVPILVRLGMHHVVANTAALGRAHIARDTPSPAGVRIERDEHGDPTGLVLEGFDLFPVDPPPGPDLEALLRAELVESYARFGVTTVYEIPASAAGVGAYRRLHAGDRLPVRMSINPVVRPGLNGIVDRVGDLPALWEGAQPDGERLWLGAAKVFLDGGYEAALSRSHLDLPPSRWGVPTRDYTGIVGLLVESYRARTQVWLHALGDITQHLALDAIEEAVAMMRPTDHRTRLEHAGNSWVDDDLVARLVRTGTIPVPQPAFIGSDDGGGRYAFGTFVAAGLRPPGNSDSGGVTLANSSPWHCIAAMMLRRNAAGVPVAEQERVDLGTALRCYTADGAYAGFRENALGTVEVGRRADCVVLDDDPFRLDVGRLAATEAAMTIVDGRVEWDGGTGPSPAP